LDRKTSSGKDVAEDQPPSEARGKKASGSGNGSWQKIEALREKAALKASLADVWDEDFDLDEDILADLDHKAEFFTTQEEEPEDLPDDDDVDDFYEDDDV
jgi:hypothetical protein